jgi:hypothetical protein
MRPRPDKVWVTVITRPDGIQDVTVHPTEFAATGAVCRYVIEEWPKRYFSSHEMPRGTYVTDFFTDQEKDSYQILERNVEYGGFETELEKPLVLAELFDLGTVCPSQWEGKTDDGKRVYIRYRWGYLNLDVDGETILGRQVGDEYGGLMDYTQLQYWLADVVMLPDYQMKSVWEEEETTGGSP